MMIGLGIVCKFDVHPLTLEKGCDFKIAKYDIINFSDYEKTSLTDCIPQTFIWWHMISQIFIASVLYYTYTLQ